MGETVTTTIYKNALCWAMNIPHAQHISGITSSSDSDIFIAFYYFNLAAGKYNHPL